MSNRKADGLPFVNRGEIFPINSAETEFHALENAHAIAKVESQGT